MSSDTVRCSRPDDFVAPNIVPTTAQHKPTRNINSMNHLIDTVCDTVTPQHDFGSC